MKTETILVAGWGKNESVLINKADFDPKKHKEYKPKAKPKAKK